MNMFLESNGIGVLFVLMITFKAINRLYEQDFSSDYCHGFETDVDIPFSTKPH